MPKDFTAFPHNKFTIFTVLQLTIVTVKYDLLLNLPEQYCNQGITL